MTLTQSTLSSVLAAFRASTPTPGGGSAAALAGAVGAGLLAMVAGLPKPRASSPEEIERLRRAGEACSAVASSLEAAIDADSDAYDAVVAAYKLAKGSDDEKRERSARIQAALTGATEVPLGVMRGCAAALAEADVIASLGNANAASDVGVARELLRAARHGARLNVEINLDGLRDHDYVARVRDEAAALSR
jgi:formiminotetrahydrofolate cyclodeaminase